MLFRWVSELVGECIRWCVIKYCGCSAKQQNTKSGCRLTASAKCKMTDLRICWLKVCFCSEETSAEGNPGACSVSSSHWASRTGQCRFRASRTSEKCSVRLRGDMPPTAWDSRGRTAVTWNARHEQGGGAFHHAAYSPVGWSRSAGCHPAATPQPMPGYLCIGTVVLSASAGETEQRFKHQRLRMKSEISDNLVPTYKEETCRFYCGRLWEFQG